jgi:intracellular sulfur oxidation DsrE/DsrF family protein
MKALIIISFSLATIMSQPVSVLALDDALAFSGLTSTRAIYDVRTNEEKKLHFIFQVIRDTFDEATQQDVKQRYIVSMRGPTVKLLVRERQGDKELQKKTRALIDELNHRGMRLEACGYALNLFGVEPEDLYSGVHAVGNSLNTLIGYQTKGYALVPMN